MTGTVVEKGTISVQLVREALLELRARGLDPAPLLGHAGIAAEALERPYGRVSSQQYARLWLRLAECMDDEFFGMNPRRMKSGSFAFMARAALKEPSLGAALEGVLGFLDLVFDGLAAPGAPGRDGGDRAGGGAGRGPARLRLLHPVDDRPRPGLLAGRAAHPHPRHRPALPGARVHRGLPGDVQRQPALRPAAHAPAVQRRLPGVAGAPQRARARASVAHRPTSWCATATRRAWRPASAPTCAACAPSAGRTWRRCPATSSWRSTLRRKLALEDQSYQALRTRCAATWPSPGCTAARATSPNWPSSWLRRCQRLHKAFRKWTGTTPGQYRELMHPGPPPT